MNAIAQASAAPARGPKLDNRRVAAGIVDLVIVAAGAAVVLFAGDALTGDGSEVRGALGAVILGWALYYFFALESGDGQTVGKKLMKLRVVRANGHPAGMREIAVRTVLRVVDNYLVGLIVMLATGERRQRVGDLAAGTVVVDASVPAGPVATEQVEDEVTAFIEPDVDAEDEAEEAPDPVASQTITLPSRPAPPATLADLTEATEVAEEPVVEEPVVEPEPVVEVEEDVLPEFTSPSLEELAHDVAAAQAEPEVMVEPEPQVVVEPEPEVVVEPQPEVVVEPEPEVMVEPDRVDDLPDDEPMTVRSVETVSAIDLVMGGASEEDSSDGTSQSAQDPEDSASL
ncbi:MAG TPA: RDD family protein [Gaiellaceae bacterium]|jgi:uncharacterized RDD family membrane protein YckC